MKNTNQIHIQISVIVCVYNCNSVDLISTLESILCQNNINIQIIIADDHSNVNYIYEVNSYMMKKNFLNYKYIRNEVNLGTVKNILNATKYCIGEYIKPIGSGDLLYDNNTLNSVYYYMKNKNYQICFGNGISYKEEKNNFFISKYNSPLIKKPYIKNEKHRIKKNLVIYGDQISGALTFYSRDCLIKYLSVLCDKVIYTEDYMPRLIALDNIDIGYIDKNVVFYQYGTGISTNKNKKNSTRINRDEEEFTSLIAEYKPNDYYIEKYLKFWSLRNKKSMYRIINKVRLQPDYLIYYCKSYYYLKKNFKNWKEISDQSFKEEK